MAHFFNNSRFSAASLPSMDTVEKKHDVSLIARTEIQYTIGTKRNKNSPESDLTRAMAICAASLKCLMMFCGCTPSSTKGLHSRRNSPARMTTVVVPSPTSESCDFAMSTRDLAAGCTMSRSFMMVAPSLEMVVVPRSSCTSLSSPRGPCGWMGGDG